jgi:hypothetical protein
MDDDHKSNFTDADRTKIQASRRRPLARFPKREIKADISSFLARHSAIVRACGFAVWPDLPVFIFPHIIDQGDKGRFGLAFQDAQGTHFITKHRMCGRFSALGSTDVQVRSFKFHVGPLQLSEFTGPQAHDETQEFEGVDLTRTLVIASKPKLPCLPMVCLERSTIQHVNSSTR